MPYYKVIAGKKHDKALLDIADEGIKKKKTISMAVAKNLVKKVRDEGTYTAVEKQTMKYIRESYKFDSDADIWIRGEIRSWAAIRGSHPKAAPKSQAKSKAVKRYVKKAPSGNIAESHDKQSREELERLMVTEPLPAKNAKKQPGAWKLIALLIFIIIAIIIVFKAPFQKIFKADKPRAQGDSSGVADEIKAPGDAKVSDQPNAPESGQKVVQDQAVKAPEPQQKPEKKEAPLPEGTYRVEIKDSLISISEKMTGDYRNWYKIYQANKDSIKNPVIIFPGQRIVIPEEIRKK
jgi:hypothetical protein